jgi:hypothetical protein
MEACDCNASLANTGVDCTPILEIADKLIAVPLKDSTGARNSIDLTQTLNAAFWTGKVNDTDPTQRWYPLPSMKNANDERAESIKETFEDNSTAFIQQGVRAFSAVVVDDGTQILQGKLETFRCQDFGFYVVDINGNLIGSLGNGQDGCEPSYLYPIAVDRGSFDPRFMKKTNNSAQKVMLSFNWKMTEQDKNLRMITATEAGYDLSSLTGLRDVCAVISDIDNTEFTVDLRVTGFGTLLNPVRVEGLVAGDFTLYNVTDAASVSVSTATETSDGIYTITFASQTNGDVLRLTPTLSGYDFTSVIAEEIQMPLT